MNSDFLEQLYVIYKTVKSFIIPAAIVTGGFIAGFLFEKIAGRYIKRFVEKTAWKGDDIIVAALHGKTKYIFLILSCFIAIRYVPLNEQQLYGLDKGLTIVFIIVVTLLVIKIANQFFIFERSRQHDNRPINSIIQTITKITILTIGVLISLQFMGISITPILTALGVTGLAVALALQETLSNIFSGVYIIATRQIVVGNYIQLDENVEGYVRDITWRHTTIETIAHNMVVIPNSKLSSSIVVNYSMPRQEMNLVINIGVSYNSDLNFVETVTIDAARSVLNETPGAVDSVEPFVRFHAFDDFSINFSLIVRIREFSDKYKIRHELVKRIHEYYKKEEIEIPFPIRTVHIKDTQGS